MKPRGLRLRITSFHVTETFSSCSDPLQQTDPPASSASHIGEEASQRRAARAPADRRDAAEEPTCDPWITVSPPRRPNDAKVDDAGEPTQDIRPPESRPKAGGADVRIERRRHPTVDGFNGVLHRLLLLARRSNCASRLARPRGVGRPRQAALIDRRHAAPRALHRSNGLS